MAISTGYANSTGDGASVSLPAPPLSQQRLTAGINLPVCGVALVLLFFFLNLNPSTGNVADLKRTYDFLGLYVCYLRLSKP